MCRKLFWLILSVPLFISSLISNKIHKKTLISFLSSKVELSIFLYSGCKDKRQSIAGDFQAFKDCRQYYIEWQTCFLSILYLMGCLAFPQGQYFIFFVLIPAHLQLSINILESLKSLLSSSAKPKLSWAEVTCIIPTQPPTPWH